MKMLLAVVSLLLFAAAGAMGGLSTDSTKLLWKTKLYDTTYDPTRRVNDFSMGYSVTVGDAYVTTDMNGTMYVIGLETGAIRWSYNGWPTLPSKEAVRRQITGTASVIAVLRHDTLFGFNATDGTVLFNKTLTPTELHAGSVFMYADNLFLSYNTGFKVLDLRRQGAVLWGHDNVLRGHDNVVNQPVQTSADRHNSLVAALIGNTSNTSRMFVWNASNGGALVNTIPLPASIAQLAYVYIFHVSSTHLMLFASDSLGGSSAPNATSVIKVKIADGTVVFNIRTGTFQGYGMGDDVFFFHTTTSLASFNRTSGEKIAETSIKKLPGHLLGYNTFAILAMDTLEGGLEVASFDAMTMNHTWSVYPPTDRSRVLQGNWPGTLIAPSTNGITLINGTTGKTIWSDTSAFKDVNPESLALGNTHLYFTHGAYAVGIRYGA